MSYNYPGTVPTTGGYPSYAGQQQQQPMMSNTTTARCPGGHTLMASPMPGAWLCDTCSSRHAQTEQSWGCRQCNFDCCTECMNRQQQQQQQQLPSATGMMQPVSSTSSVTATSVSECDNGHPFVFANFGVTQRWACDFCKGVFTGGASYGCRPCNIDFCTACHDKQAAKIAKKKEDARQKQEAEALAKKQKEEAAALALAQAQAQQEEEERLRQEKEEEEKRKKQQAKANAALLAQQNATGSVLLCPARHPLRKGTLSSNIQWKCDKCLKMTIGGDSYGCRTCDYDQCAPCSGKANGPTTSTADASSLLSSTPTPAVTTMTNSSTDVPCWGCGDPLSRCELPQIIWKCDKCMKDHRGGTSYGCRTCNQDACQDCYNKIKATSSMSSTTSTHHQTTTNGGTATTTTTTTSYNYSSSSTTPSSYKPPSAASIMSKMNFGLHSEDSNEFLHHHNNKPSSHQQQHPGSQVSAHLSSNPSNKPSFRCLFIGINYPGTRAELRGCHNDVLLWQKVLHHLGFDISDRRVLIDDRLFRGRTGEPDKKGIMDSMKWLSHDLKPNSRIFFQYSGHGTQLPDDDGDEGVDGKDEALVPADYQKAGCLRDDWVFDNMIKPLPKDCFGFCVSDCCHSGSILDLEFGWKWEGEEKKFAPRKNYRTRDFFAATNKHADATVIALSGCGDTQTSSDVSSTIDFHHKFGKSMPGSAGGAMSNCSGEAISNAPKDAEGQPDFSFMELLFRIQEGLKKRKFTQYPELSCTKRLDLNKKFTLLHPDFLYE